MSNSESHLSVMGFTLLSVYLTLQNKDSMSQDIWIVGHFQFMKSQDRTAQLLSQIKREIQKDNEIKNKLGLKQSPEKEGMIALQ